jgi:hypothetical protein
MTPQQRAAASHFDLSEDDKFEQFDTDKQEWQDSNAAYRAESKVLRDAEMKQWDLERAREIEEWKKEEALQHMNKSSNILQTFVKSFENEVKVAYGDLNAPGTATIEHLGSINKN